MDLVRKLNTFLNKRMFIIVFVGITAGLLFSSQLFAGKPAVPYVFAYITFSLALGTGFADLKGVLKFPLPMLATLLCLHVISPLFAYALGLIFYGKSSLLTTGLILTTAIPVGVSSIIWVGLTRGHVPLALTTVAVDSLASPVTVPLVIMAFLGKAVTFDAQGMVVSLIQMVFLPTVFGVAIHDWGGEKVAQMDRSTLALLSKLGLSFVVGVNVAASKEYLYTAGSHVILLFFVLVTMISFNFFLGYIASKLAKFPREVSLSMLFQVGIRNISAGVVIALNYFPPAAALPCIMALLIQQPSASIILHFIEKRSSRK